MVYERLGQQLLRLDLSTIQRFYAVSAIVVYTTGVGAELRQPVEDESTYSEADRAAILGRHAAVWLDTDPDEFPFVHEVAGEFATHQDVDQFTAGLDLLLAGLRQQAG